MSLTILLYLVCLYTILGAPIATANVVGHEKYNHNYNNEENFLMVEMETRLQYLRRASVWHEMVDEGSTIASADMFNGPLNIYGIKTHQVIDCVFLEPAEPEDQSWHFDGSTPKFDCEYTYAAPLDDNGEDEMEAKPAPPFKARLRIKYDQQYNSLRKWSNIGNEEVYASVVSQRILWALGFGADGSIPVTVNCINCPIEPWTYIQNIEGFDEYEASCGWIDLDLIQTDEWYRKYPVVQFQSAIVQLDFALQGFQPIQNTKSVNEGFVRKIDGTIEIDCLKEECKDDRQYLEQRVIPHKAITYMYRDKDDGKLSKESGFAWRELFTGFPHECSYNTQNCKDAPAAACDARSYIELRDASLEICTDELSQVRKQRVYRDALTILAAFLSHGDNFDCNQGFVCLKSQQAPRSVEVTSESATNTTTSTAAEAAATTVTSASIKGHHSPSPSSEVAADFFSCAEPYVYIKDVGATLGSGLSAGTPRNISIDADTTVEMSDHVLENMHLEKWLNISVWGNMSTCEVYVNGIPGSSWHGNMGVSEEGRSMLARLFSYVTHRQIVDAFTAARVHMMRGDSISDWVAGFEHKLKSQLIDVSCNG